MEFRKVGTAINSDGLPKVPVALRPVRHPRTHKICMDCGEPINAKRLSVVPQTSYCAICQKATERERARPARWFDDSAFLTG